LLPVVDSQHGAIWKLCVLTDSGSTGLLALRFDYTCNGWRHSRQWRFKLISEGCLTSCYDTIAPNDDLYSGKPL
jgi:hypothetical protein